MGVLPMLQFTTAFTYNMFRNRREQLRANPPYCLHAIFAHGHEPERKVAIFREEVCAALVEPPARAARLGSALAQSDARARTAPWHPPLCPP